ncbi:uncharacterized protein VICG_00339 [Vittaforma corneae ATCC 50505]|uniref:Uncharacterized protein n=1 Tax=Vittaforma corneae (strain ATCC 50505) TaxID=993615 RepID=L2GQK3_VITCO|nr:uncharacterized protein VICG_00339 [Vittaforma corneae ATCC 50505]ELA42587.1 hypothetical protein VICG_00339 [Vittaforma corneae ATCC 50505]
MLWIDLFMPIIITFQQYTFIFTFIKYSICLKMFKNHTVLYLSMKCIIKFPTRKNVCILINEEDFINHRCYIKPWTISIISNCDLKNFIRGSNLKIIGPLDIKKL